MSTGRSTAPDSELEASLDGPPSQEPTVGVSRHEKSLGLLTSKFVALLQSAEDGILDLKAVRTSTGGHNNKLRPHTHFLTAETETKKVNGSILYNFMRVSGA